MRNRLLILFLFVPILLRGQEYPEFFSLPDSITNEYLDTVQIPSHKRPNDNWLVGGFGGVTLLSGYFNPVWATDLAMHAPTWGFSIIKNSTMMNMFPNVGLEVGFQYTWEGYRFKRSKETGNLRYVYGTYAYDAAIRVPEVFMLTNGHFDIGDHFKLLVKAGMYGGYRESIYRKAYWEHPEIDYTPTDAMASNFESIRTTFLDNENRYTAGLSFGAGFGLMFDPIEIHFNALVNWGFITFYDPDFLGEGIYYRYAYPLDGAVTVGLYYQLTPRVGRTRGELRRLAREMAEKNKSKK
jgi:hypothetical protein